MCTTQFTILLVLWISSCWTWPFAEAIVYKLPTITVTRSTIESAAILFQNTTHIVVSKTESSVVLLCNSSYPVMWSLDSLEQPWALETSSYRMFDNFRNPETYSYAMSVTLYNQNEFEDQISLEPEQYECHGTTADNPVTAAMVTVIWEAKYNVSEILPNPKGKGRKIFASDAHLLYNLNRDNHNLTIEYADGQVTCCIKPGYKGPQTAAHMVIDYNGCTSQQLVCFTRKHASAATTYILRFPNDHAHKQNCRRINATAEFGAAYHGTQMLFTCHMRTDQLLTRDEYAGDYNLNSHLHHSENAYLVVNMRSPTSTSLLQFFDPSVGWYVSDISNVTLYDGQVAAFRCQDGGPFFGSPTVWELRWKNGTLEFNPNTLPSIEHDFKVTLTADLAKISCHLPLWNSSEWVTHSLVVNNVAASRAPTSISGQNSSSAAVEEVEFFVGETRVLDCDLEGYPPATYAWNLYSYVYTFHPHEAVSLSSTRPKPRNVTVSVSAAYSVQGSTLPLPSERFTCTATNLVGNSSKTFKVQGLRGVKPEFAYGSRQVVVFFLHEDEQMLNCTVRKGLPAPVLHWEHHGAVISSAGFDIQSNGNSSTLTFKKAIDYGDEGDYKCVATNFAGIAFKMFSVRIRERPPTKIWHELLLCFLILVAVGGWATVIYVFVTKSKMVDRLRLQALHSNSNAFELNETRNISAANGL